jgi:RES domain-containing protein
MLEKLVHSNGVLPPNQHYIDITIPNDVSYEEFQPASHPGWGGKSEAVCKKFGEAWFLAKRSAILIVPSIPARIEKNYLINPAHPDAKGITYDMPSPVWWDDRLFGS